MHFLFKTVVSEDKRNYVTKKLTAIASSLQHQEQSFSSVFVDEQVNIVMAIDVAGKIAIASEGDFYRINRKQEFLIDVSKQCAIQALAHESPLIEKEVVEEDFFSYLTKPFEDFDAGTGVLLRRTNMAEIYYLFEGIKINHDGIEYLETDQVIPLEAMSNRLLGGAIDDKVKKIITGLLSKAAGSAASELGAFIINIVIKELFGHDDNKELIEQIQNVVRAELQSNEVDKINALIQGTIRFLTNEYRVRKEKSDLTNIDERKELLYSLSSYSHDFYSGVLSLLEQKKYAKKGLVSYQMAAAVHLIITQEQALVDWKTMDPNQSSYAITLQLNARTYHDHIKTTFNTVRTERLAKITSKHDPDYACNGRTGCHVSREAWSWGDSEIHEGKKFYSDMDKNGPSAQSKAESAARNQRNRVSQQLTERFADPQNSSLPHLEKLAKNKIGL